MPGCSETTNVERRTWDSTVATPIDNGVNKSKIITNKKQRYKSNQVLVSRKTMYHQILAQKASVEKVQTKPVGNVEIITIMREVSMLKLCMPKLRRYHAWTAVLQNTHLAGTLLIAGDVFELSLSPLVVLRLILLVVTIVCFVVVHSIW